MTTRRALSAVLTAVGIGGFVSEYGVGMGIAVGAVTFVVLMGLSEIISRLEDILVELRRDRRTP